MAQDNYYTSSTQKNRLLHGPTPPHDYNHVMAAKLHNMQISYVLHVNSTTQQDKAVPPKKIILLCHVVDGPAEYQVHTNSLCVLYNSYANHVLKTQQ